MSSMESGARGAGKLSMSEKPGVAYMHGTKSPHFHPFGKPKCGSPCPQAFYDTRTFFGRMTQEHSLDDLRVVEGKCGLQESERTALDVADGNRRKRRSKCALRPVEMSRGTKDRHIVILDNASAHPRVRQKNCEVDAYCRVWRI